MAISELPASDIAKYLREHPEAARALLSESYGKDSEWVGSQGTRNASAFRSSRIWQMRLLTISCSHLAGVAGRLAIDETSK